MSIINVITEIRIDGHPSTDVPFTTTVLPEQWQTLNVVKSQDEEGVYNLVPTVSAFPIIEAILLFNVDQDVTYMLQGQQTSCIPVCAGGLLMLLNPNIDVERLNLRVNNPDGPGTIVGFVGGKGVPLSFPPVLNMVVDERWETTEPPPPTPYPVPTVLVIDERWEAAYPTPGTLVIDERWEAGPPTGCPTPVLVIHEDFETQLCPTPNQLVHETFELET